jgi:dipeptidase D
VLLNLDSEDEGVFVIGCAGGQNSLITLPVEWELLDFKEESSFGLFRLSVEGLEGGHSGVEIDKQRANGIQLLSLALSGLRDRLGAGNLKLILINGGSVHNAIPSTAEAFIALRRDKLEQAGEAVSALKKTFQAEYAKTDPGLILSLEKIGREIIFEVAGDKRPEEEAPNIRILSAGTEEKLIQLLLGLPHGVYRMSENIPGLVETSNNLATVRTTENEIMIVSSQRSSSNLRLAEITGKVEAVAKLAGAWIEHEPGYPAWEPDLESELLMKCRQVYSRVFGKEPEVKVIHAGLECGIIGSVHEGMEMISFGPTIKDPHCPSERIFIPSIEKVWIFLENLLSSYRC